MSTPEKRAQVWVKRLDYILSLDLPFYKVGIAHLACSIMAPNHDVYIATLNAIPTDEMVRLFKKCAKLGVGIELNLDDMDFKVSDEYAVLRMFRIAKEQGCKVYLGSDVHHPQKFDKAQKVFQNAIDLLGLEESDKLVIKR